MSIQPDEYDDKLSEYAEQAVDADGDTEDELVRLQGMADARRRDPDLEKRYEALRNNLVRNLRDSGPRWFRDADGEKWLAFIKAPQKTILDVEKAVRAYEEGEISAETLDLIAPRGQSLAGIKRAILESRLTSAQIQDLLSFEPGTPYVAFGQPGDDTRG